MYEVRNRERFYKCNFKQTRKQRLSCFLAEKQSIFVTKNRLKQNEIKENEQNLCIFYTKP